MDSSTFYHAETSFASRSSDAPAEVEKVEVASQNSDRVYRLYKPNFYHLVSATKGLRFLPDVEIPRYFYGREAVDTARQIGRGASFAVGVQPVPQNIKWSRPSDSAEAVRRRPRHVVYKVAVARFQPDGEPVSATDRRALQSVLTELHALQAPGISKHTNIIDLLGLAWGSHPDDPDLKLPVLMVEFGDKGTLADVQLRGPALDDSVKQSLCLGIAEGLQILHEHGIVHGDLKPDNIIMCSDHKQRLVPKLADFGFAVMEEVEHTEKIMIGGTRLWRAPEASEPIIVSDVKLTDIYSLGLVIWSIAIDGSDPFSLLLNRDKSPPDRMLEIDEIKRKDLLIQLSMFENWILPWSSRKIQNLSMDRLQVEQALKGLQALKLADSVPGAFLDAPELKPQFEKLCETRDQLLKAWRCTPFWRILEPLFINTLGRDPHKRSLDATLAVLRQSPISSDQISDVRQLLGGGREAQINASWQLARDLDPSVQRLVLKRQLERKHNDDSRFQKLSILFNGYGAAEDIERALEYGIEGIHDNKMLPGAYVYRLHKATGREVPKDVDIKKCLVLTARMGSRMALADLESLDKEQADEIKLHSRYMWGGVYSTWYQRVEILHGLTQPLFVDNEVKLDLLGPSDKLQDVIVNKRGDGLLHMAAAVGGYYMVKKLLEQYKFDVNQRNTHGDTALLCACRSGHPGVTSLLLDHGADASVASLNGETPLHWLYSFAPDINVAAVGKDLISRGGAKVDAYTTQRVNHSNFASNIDVDFQLPGTPLMWAVHHDQPYLVSFLLSVGADPHWRLDEAELSSLQWAASYHHVECLKLIISHLEGRMKSPSEAEEDRRLQQPVDYEVLVRRAVHASDKFSMILRHGDKYMERLRSVFTYLDSKRKLSGIRMFHWRNALYYAASKGHTDACEVILDLGWPSEEINGLVPHFGRTPLLESVRWNRRPLFQILRRRGADVSLPGLRPYDRSQKIWSALHVFAEEGHDDDLTLAQELIDAGLPVDGDRSLGTETPFYVAVCQNAFNLADLLLANGADTETSWTHAGLWIAGLDLTSLGHLVARNSRYGFHSLRYLCRIKCGFVVQRLVRLTALHVCAFVPHDLRDVDGYMMERKDFDFETNAAIAKELLQWFRQKEQVDARCDAQGKTALHLAAENGNVGVARELVLADADRSLCTEAGETAKDIAQRRWAGKDCGTFQKLKDLLA